MFYLLYQSKQFLYFCNNAMLLIKWWYWNREIGELLGVNIGLINGICLYLITPFSMVRTIHYKVYIIRINKNTANPNQIASIDYWFFYFKYCRFSDPFTTISSIKK